jgi:hypothetical protein
MACSYELQLNQGVLLGRDLRVLLVCSVDGCRTAVRECF